MNHNKKRTNQRNRYNKPQPRGWAVVPGYHYGSSTAVEKPLSGYTVEAVDGYEETNSFKDAISQHNQYIQKLTEAIDRAQKRIAVLTEAQNQKIFNHPREYDEYQISLAKQKEIEKRRQEMERQEAARQAEKEKQLQIRKAKQEAIDESYRKIIREKFEYALRCAKYLGNDTIECYGADSDITSEMTVEMCLTNVSDLSIYWQNIENVIIEAHEAHNNQLIENDTTEYDCPGCYGYDDPWDEAADHCYALASDGRTHGCGKKVYWDTSSVDFMNDLTLDSTSPEGYINNY